MKLLIISHAYQGEQYLSSLEAMVKVGGTELALLCPAKLMGASSCWGPRNGIQKFAIPVGLGFRQGTFYYRPRDLESVLESFQPDVILHEQEVYALGAGQIAMAASRRSIPIVMFVWENTHRQLSVPRRWSRDYVLRRSAALIAGSEQARRVHRDWGFSGPAVVIPQMGIEVNNSPRFGRRDPQSLKVCFAGRLEKLKGVDCLIRAVAKLHSEGVSIACRLAGNGREQMALTDLVQRLGVQECVTFCGFLSGEALQTLFRGSDLLVLPSRRTRDWHEQFGRVLPEAMAQACVTVGSNTGAIPEVIGEKGLLFEENDVRQLASILKRMAEDSELLESYQRRLWMRAKELYTNDHLARRRIEFLQNILQPVRSNA
jgi:glycosyltransferase involved in cell wall biosynthesis